MASLLNMSGGSLLKKGLPYDYEVEYLENNGVAFIDLSEYVPIVSGGDVSVDIDANLKEESETWSQAFIYMNDSNSSRVLALSKSRTNDSILLRYFCQNDYTINVQLKRHKYNIDKDYLTIDGRSYKHNLSSETGGYNNQTRFYLWSSPLYSFKVQMALYSFVLSQNGDIILDLIPVVKDNVGYMYDKVSGQLFGNAGTGDFIVGQRV